MNDEEYNESLYSVENANKSFLSNSSVDVELLFSPSMASFMYVMYITISVLAIGGNGIVCYIVLSYKKMRTVTNFFILNLAIGDILMAVLCIPFTFISTLILGFWPFGTVMCKLVSYSQAISVFVSAYTMVAISCDRYIAIIYPLKPRMTKTQTKLTIAFVWFVAIVTPLPTAIYSTLSRPPHWIGDTYVCTEVWTNQDYFNSYSITLMTLQYLLPFGVLVYTYVRIALVVWGKRVPGEAEDGRDRKIAASKRKMIKMMITVVVIFTVCWLPFNVLMVIGNYNIELWRIPLAGYLYFIFHWLSMSHACCNPVIYCWMNARFRSGFIYTFRWCPCCGIKGSRWGQGGGRGLRRGVITTNTLTTSLRDRISEKREQQQMEMMEMTFSETETQINQHLCKNN